MGTRLHGMASRTGKIESRAGKIDGRWFRRLRLLRPGTPSVAHFQQNLAAAKCALPDDAVKELDGVTSIGSA